MITMMKLGVISKLIFWQVDLDVGHLHHYRSYCVDLVKDCEESYMRHTVKDTSVWTWKDAVIRNSADVLRKLGFF